MKIITMVNMGRTLRLKIKENLSIERTMPALLTIFLKMMIWTKMATSTGQNLEEGKNNKDDLLV